MNADALAKYEILVPDERVERETARLRVEFGPRIADTDFVTFIQPARTVDHRLPDSGLTVPIRIPDKAVFAVVTPNPRRPSQKILTSMTTNLSDWEASERDRSHYVGKADPIGAFFRKALIEHLPMIENLKEMI